MAPVETTGVVTEEVVVEVLQPPQTTLLSTTLHQSQQDGSIQAPDTRTCPHLAVARSTGVEVPKRPFVTVLLTVLGKTELSPVRTSTRTQIEILTSSTNMTQ